MPAAAFERIKTFVDSLLPEFAERAAESEQARRMPADLAQRLKDAHVFSLTAPRRVGGAEASQIEIIKLLEGVARADASAAWTIMIGTEGPSVIADLSRDVYERLFRDTPNLVCSGTLVARGKAEQVPGGYRMTGRWPWASGCLHADYLLVAGAVHKDGAQLPGIAPHMPLARLAIIPVSQGKRHYDDTWFVAGMSGTGSCDISCEDVFVPEEMTFKPLEWSPNGDERTLLPLIVISAPRMGAIAVGAAQGAIEDTIAIAKAGKQRVAASLRSAEQPVFQYRLAEADVRVRAARALVYEHAEWIERDGGTIPKGLMSLLHPLAKSAAVTGAFACNLAAEAIDICCEIAGGSAVASASPLQRRRRDVDVIRSHAGMGDPMVTRFGAGLLDIQAMP